MRAKTYPIKNEILQFSLLARVPVCVDDGEEECKLFLTTNFIVYFTSFCFFLNIYMSDYKIGVERIVCTL
jgi:hypothetical protein